MPTSAKRGQIWGTEKLRAGEVVDARGVVGREWELGRLGAARLATNAVQHEADVADVAAHRGCFPAVAIQDFENFVAGESVWGLHLANGLVGVRSAAEYLAERAGRDIDDPVGDIGVRRGFTRQGVDGGGRQVHK